VTLLAALALAAWLWLALLRGRFWQAAPAPLPRPVAGDVAAVIPARDEEATIGRTVRSLVRQGVPVLVVDDQSRDATAAAARGAGAEVLAGAPLPEGWTGKLWALEQGVERLASEWVLLTDADIEHHPTSVGELLAFAEAEDLDLASLMVRLNCESLPERLAVPAFVFLFALLYPFAWVGDPERATAAAAGGCILVRRAALERIGFFTPIRDRLIDDCALAAAVKESGGRIWLGLSRETASLRRYPRLGDIWRMVARTAYTQLGYSPLALAGTVLGLGALFLVPPLAFFTGGWASLLGAAGWLVMSALYWPMLRFYGLSPLWAPLLPLTALVYLGATLDSARRHWQGRGGEWKGRVRRS
jgi:hopene-associated glycosyltransferase HpnB